ncbi:MAG: twin-arginine translocation signal domain-containing protein [Acidobacteria bacterium]|jgi:hypothetical protein|nr:twin-arginine translocation signal domain-containing protein [Acidobacteriota bacterium]
MGEEKNLGRRSFLKGATLAGVATAIGSGIFGQDKLWGQSPSTEPYVRSDVKEPQGVREDRDVNTLANNLLTACLESAIDTFNSASESIVKGNQNQVNIQNFIERQGAQLQSRESKAASNKNVQVPPSILRIREEQLKQKGWHSHVSASGCLNGNCIRAHWHVTW